MKTLDKDIKISQMIELQKFDAIDIFDLDLGHKCRQFYH